MSPTKPQNKLDKKAIMRRHLGDMIADVASMSNELNLTTQARIDPSIVDDDQLAQIKLSKLMTGFDTCVAVCINGDRLYASNNTGHSATVQECARLLVSCDRAIPEDRKAIRDQLIDRIFTTGSSYLKDQFGRNPHLFRNLNRETRDVSESDIDTPTKAKLQLLNRSIVEYNKLLTVGEGAGAVRASSDAKETKLATILELCNDLRKSDHPRLQNFKILLQPMVSEISQDVDVVLSNAQLRNGMSYLTSGMGFVSGRTGQSVIGDSDLFTHAETKLALYKDCGTAKIFTTKLACDACYILCEDQVLGTHGKPYAWPVPSSLTSSQLERMTASFSAQRETLRHALDARDRGTAICDIKGRFKLHEFGPDTPHGRDQSHDRTQHAATRGDEDVAAVLPRAAAAQSSALAIPLKIYSGDNIPKPAQSQLLHEGEPGTNVQSMLGSRDAAVASATVAGRAALTSAAARTDGTAASAAAPSTAAIARPQPIAARGAWAAGPPKAPSGRQ